MNGDVELESQELGEVQSDVPKKKNKILKELERIYVCFKTCNIAFLSV